MSNDLFEAQMEEESRRREEERKRREQERESCLQVAR